MNDFKDKPLCPSGPPPIPIPHGNLYFCCPNMDEDIRHWSWCISGYRGADGAKSLEEALDIIKLQLNKASALPELTPSQSRKKSQTHKACFEMLVSILAYFD